MQGARLRTLKRGKNGMTDNYKRFNDYLTQQGDFLKGVQEFEKSMTEHIIDFAKRCGFTLTEDDLKEASPTEPLGGATNWCVCPVVGGGTFDDGKGCGCVIGGGGNGQDCSCLLGGIGYTP
jgi:hypothetical protein